MTPKDSAASATPLFDYGATAAATKSAAHANAKPKQPARQRQILTLLREYPEGLTRHEIAAAQGWPLSSVCGPVLGLLRDQLVIEQGTRLSPYGSPAAVVMSAPNETGAAS